LPLFEKKQFVKQSVNIPIVGLIHIPKSIITCCPGQSNWSIKLVEVSHVSCVMCHVSCVMCHVSCQCHLSVACLRQPLGEWPLCKIQKKLKKKFKVVTIAAILCRFHIYEFRWWFFLCRPQCMFQSVDNPILGPVHMNCRIFQVIKLLAKVFSYFC